MATKGYTDYEAVGGAYPGVSGDFINEQRNRRGFGVTNVATTASGNQTQRSGRARRRLSDQNVDEGEAESEEERRSRVTSYKRRKQREMVYSAVKESLSDQSRLAGLLGRNTSTKVAAKKPPIPVLNLVIAGSWTYIFLYTASIFGLLFLFLFFGTAIIEELLWGMTIESLRTGAYACYGIQLSFSLIVIGGILGQLKLTGVNALGGKGGAVKQMVFILTILPMLIPGGPFFIPWYTPWLIVVGRYPR